MTSFSRVAGWLVMTVLATAIALVSIPYVLGGGHFDEQRAVFEAHPILIRTHVAGGIAALLVGPWQFVTSLRARRPRLHRALGRVYLLGVAIGVLGGAALAPLAYGGVVPQLGFMGLALAWGTSSAAALHAIRRGDVERHRRWMVRSYACTFAAVTLRLWLPLLGLALPFEVAYRAVAWLAWVPNLLAVEVALRRRSQLVHRPADAAA